MNFWSYFRDKLSWPLIFSPGPLSILIKGGAQSLDQARQDIIWLIQQANPETCENIFLPLHGKSRGITRWPDEPTDFFRIRCINAFSWQAQAGKSRGIESIMFEAGINAKIIEPDEINEALAKSGARLDGRLTDGFLMDTPREARGRPVLDWAEYLVEFNWAESSAAGLRLARQIQTEYKAARSLDIFRVYLGLNAPIPSPNKSETKGLAKSVIPDNPWLRLDGTWDLGRDAYTARLDGSWMLEGPKLGRIISGKINKRLRDHRLSTGATAKAALVVPPGRGLKSEKPFISLGIENLRLNGKWNLGSGKPLDGLWNLDGMAMLKTGPKLGSHPLHRLANQPLGFFKEYRSWPAIK